jgi:hypothetical protein
MPYNERRIATVLSIDRHTLEHGSPWNGSIVWRSSVKGMAIRRPMCGDAALRECNTFVV